MTSLDKKYFQRLIESSPDIARRPPHARGKAPSVGLDQEADREG